jgi:hypothetical protein
MLRPPPVKFLCPGAEGIERDLQQAVVARNHRDGSVEFADTELLDQYESNAKVSKVTNDLGPWLCRGGAHEPVGVLGDGVDQVLNTISIEPYGLRRAA